MPIFTVPNHELSEYNHCHAPHTGWFCSGSGKGDGWKTAGSDTWTLGEYTIQRVPKAGYLVRYGARVIAQRHELDVAKRAAREHQKGH